MQFIFLSISNQMQQIIIFINFLQSTIILHFFSVLMFFIFSNAAVLFEESVVGNGGTGGSSISAYEENFASIKRHKTLEKNTMSRDNPSSYTSSGQLSAQFVSCLIFLILENKTNQPFNERLQTFVHTFETLEQCAAACPKPCAMTVMEELEMMQRWVCDPNARVGTLKLLGYK